ncbi:MAG: phasin family protein [Alphaproteobacteria bacterium]
MKEYMNTQQIETNMKKVFEQSSKNMEDMTSMTKENVEAFVQTMTIASKGMEEMMAEMMSFTKQQADDFAKVVKEVSTVKSVEDFVNQQSTFTKKTFEAYVEEMTKVGDMMIATTKDAMEPLNARMNAMSDHMSSAMNNAQV